MNVRPKQLRTNARASLAMASVFVLGFATLGLYLMFHGSAAPATYYVSKNGNNASGTSWATAWNDLSHIDWSVVNPGDTILIDGGSSSCASNYDFVALRPGVNCGMLYNSTLTVGKSGTATLPITIKLATDAGHNGTAVFFGGRATPLPYCGQTAYSPATVGNALPAAITIGAYQNVILDGTKRSGFMIYGYDDPNNNAVNGNGIGVQFTSGSASNITLRNMEIFDNGVYYKMSSTTSLNGTYNSDSKGIQPMGSNLNFERLLVHDNGQDEFQSGGPLSNVTIQDSWMYARRENPLYKGFGFNSAPHSLGCTHEDGIQVYGGGAQSGLTFTNDVFGPLLDQGIYPSGATNAYFNNLTINNVLLLNAIWNNINSDQQATSSVPTGWNIKNMTAYDTAGPADIAFSQVNVEVLSGSNSAVSNSILLNGGVHLETFTGGNNVYYNIRDNPPPGGTNTDPKFVGPLPTNNIPGYNALVAANFTPQCTSCSGEGSTLHSPQDILNLIDSLNGSTAKLGDINHDGSVNILDLSMLLSSYNTTNALCDLNTDGTVNTLDLSILLSHYGN